MIPPVHILGAGAIGALFAAELVRAGAAVTLLMRNPAAIAALQQRGGITIERDDRCETVVIRAITTSQLDQQIATLLVCTKAHQTAEAIASIANHLDANATLLLLQNGMGIREELAALYPHLTWLQGLTTEGAFRRDRFAVMHAAHGETVIGGFDASAQQRAERFAARWPVPTLPLRAVPDLRHRQWLKLAANCVVNPLTALHRCRNGELLQLPDIATTVAALCDELAQVAAADGVALDSEALQQNAFAVMRSTAANRSSMLQDVEQRRTSEIDYINGYVVRRGEALGIDCPTQRQLWQRVRALEPAA